MNGAHILQTPRSVDNVRGPLFSVGIYILQRPVNALVVYFWSTLVFRGICFQDIDANSTFLFFLHPFEQKPSLPFTLPLPSIRQSAHKNKQPPHHGKGKHAGQ